MNTPRRLAGAALLLVVTLATPLLAQTATSLPLDRDLSAALATKIAAVVTPFTDVQIVVAPQDPSLARDLGAALGGRGLRLVAQPGERSAVVRVACSDGLAERVCVATVRKGDAESVVIASRPRGSSAAAASASPLVALDVRPLFAQRDRILDLVELGEGRLLVLDGASLTLYEPDGNGLKAGKSVPVAAASPSPRDARGRLIVNGGSIEAFLAGASCRGTLDTFNVQCSESRDAAWPVGVPGSVLAPGRNFFTSSRTAPFFSAAQLGGSEWLLATLDGKWQILTGSLDVLRSLVAPGDDVAGVSTGCGSGRQVIAVVPSEGDTGNDALRAFEIDDRGATALTPATSVSGSITAIWPAAGGSRVLVVAENRELHRYEAYSVGVSCTR